MPHDLPLQDFVPVSDIPEAPSLAHRVASVSQPTAAREFPDKFDFKKENFLKAVLRHADSQPPSIGQLNRFGEPIDPNKKKISYVQDELSTAIDELFLQTGNVDFLRGKDTFRDYFSLFLDSSTAQAIDPIGKSELLKFALLSSLSPEFMSTLQFRIGVGTHDLDHTSLRLPAYIHPVVSFISKLCEFYAQKKIDITLDKLPQVVVYSAANMLKQVNRLDNARATHNAEYFFRVFRRYIEVMIPPAAHQAFIFRRDVHAHDPVIHERIGDIASRIIQTNVDPDLVMKVISTAARHHSTPSDGMRYAVAHAVYSLDPMDSPYKSFLEDEEGPLHPSVIMVGGKSEIDYWRVRQIVRASSPDHTRVQVIQKFGEVPPYSGALEEQDLTTAHLRDPQAFKARYDALRNHFRREVLAVLPPGSQRVDANIDDVVSYFRSLFDIV